MRNGYRVLALFGLAVLADQLSGFSLEGVQFLEEISTSALAFGSMAGLGLKLAYKRRYDVDPSA